MATGRRENQKTFEDTWNELKNCVPEETLHETRNLMARFHAESLGSDRIDSGVVMSGDSWIAGAVRSIRARGGIQWLRKKAEQETYDMPAKTRSRMGSIREISGLARILFTTLINCDWVPLEYKSFLFCCADDESEAEYPHKVSTHTDGGIEVHLLWLRGHFTRTTNDNQL